MHFDKQDMCCTHYSWELDSQKAIHVFSGQPSRRAFNRFNGYQVLFMINFYGSLTEQFTVKEARIIEWEIAHHLPVEIKSEMSVLNWLHETLANHVD